MPTADEVFRDYVTDGVPSSGPHRPLKSEIRAWAAGIQTGPTYDFSSINPPLRVAVETFAPGFIGGAAFNIQATWHTGATTDKDTTLRVQSIIESTAPAGGAAGAGYFGTLNKLQDNDGYGVIGLINNSSPVTVGTGAGVWGIARGAVAGGSVDVGRFSSEVDSGVHPRAGVHINNSNSGNAVDNGIFVESAVVYGVRVGIHPSDAGIDPSFVVEPTYPFAWRKKDGTQPFQVTTDGVVSSTGYKVAGTQVVGARDTGWTAMTGTPDESTAYATGSVTLPQLAGRVMALQAALTTHGLIGA